MTSPTAPDSAARCAVRAPNGSICNGRFTDERVQGFYCPDGHFTPRARASTPSPEPAGDRCPRCGAEVNPGELRDICWGGHVVREHAAACAADAERLRHAVPPDAWPARRGAAPARRDPARCERCGGAWELVGPAGWQCGSGHVIARAAWESRPPEAPVLAQAEHVAARVSQDESGPVLIRFNRVTRRRVRWLWPGRIPLGKLTILDGDPDKGKSLITLDLAARVSRGLPMPDGSTSDDPRPAGVVLLSAEDDPEDTIGPRLDAAGADSDRVVGLSVVRGPNGVELGVTLEDLDALETAIKAVDARLVVIDPFMAYLPGEVDAHHDADIRRVLRPLAELATRLGVAILLVRHLNKSAGGNPIYRGGGSIGIIGAARAGLLAAPDPDDETGERRVLATTKSNLSRAAGSLSYVIVENDEGVPCVAWGGAVAITPQALLAGTDTESRAAGHEAEAFLRDELASGALAAVSVQQAARQMGIAEMTLRRARHRLGVRVRRSGFGRGGSFIWELPGDADAIAYAESALVPTIDVHPNGIDVRPSDEHLCTQNDAQSVQPPPSATCPVHQTPLHGRTCFRCHESYCSRCGLGTGHELWPRCERCQRLGEATP